MKFHLITLISLFLPAVFSTAQCQEHSPRINPKYYLIAHRGGVVDSVTAENSTSALSKAAERGYRMVEIDLRLTKDSVLITQHDNNFKRLFGVDAIVSEMTWEQISKLKGPKGNSVLTFESVLQQCEGKLQVMIDNKISGNDTVLFSRVTALLKKYHLNGGAMMIGTDESTAFFTGKVKLSCTRKQLEENMLKPGYKPSDYYLFSDKISKADATWAGENHIQAVGVINAWGLKSGEPMKAAKKNKQDLESAGITFFQVDSEYEQFFR